jgi:hypothetical protein
VADWRSRPRTEEHLIAVAATDARLRIAGITKKLEKCRRAGLPMPQQLLDELKAARAELRAITHGNRNAKPPTPRPLTGRAVPDGR